MDISKYPFKTSSHILTDISHSVCKTLSFLISPLIPFAINSYIALDTPFFLSFLLNDGL